MSATRPSIAVPVIDGMTLFEMGLPLEALGYGWEGDQNPLYEVTLCGNLRGVRTNTGIRVVPEHPLEDLEKAETVLVPAVPPGQPVGARLLRQLHHAADRGARLVAVCTGTFALAEAGLLDGRRATTHWRHAAQLQRMYPEIDVDPRAIFTEDGGIYTSAGSAAGLDMCLHLVRLDHGERAANTAARALVIASHRDGNQAQYGHAEPLDDRATWLEGLRRWLRDQRRRPVTLDDLARVVHVSPRTLARRFERDVGTTPMRWVTAERVSMAKELLETTDLPIDRIATEVGYPSPVTFRAAFSHDTGVSPRHYRAAFSGVARAAG